ncbi:MAG: serine/threonine-protein kinase [Planctomycetota bacterium]
MAGQGQAAGKEPESAPERVIELVARCLERLDELPPEQRNGPAAEAEIQRICSDDPESAPAVRERLELLLRAGLTGDGEGGNRPRLRTLGRYRLVGELGRGGMGVVYLALDPRLGRLVALKALATRLVASDIARTRFEREIKAIAGLKHGRIVPIYEVGEAAGVPYFTMEYVEGKTLSEVVSVLRQLDVPTDELNTTHLGAATFLQPSDDDTAFDPERTPPGGVESQAPDPSSPPPPRSVPSTWGKTYVETICGMMLDVADALQHAHEHGVVHRDVKPSNILVSVDGRALLFDFGLARMELEDTVTMSGDFAGTPYYVAPEQISARGRGVDARSDVYALGVTLFELLTLRRPFEGKNAQQIFRHVLSKDPPLPRRFNKLIPRDLETICLTALEKSPDRRYQSAAEMAADLRRFLAFRPVRARPIGWPTRALRLARRHPGATTAIALAAAIAIGLPAGLGVSNLRIGREAERARLAEARAEREAERARAVNDFLIEVLSSADPQVAGAPELKVGELLDLSAARVGASFPGRPDVEAAVRRTVGNSYLALGRLNEAGEHLEAALALRRGADGGEPEAVAESLHDLGLYHMRRADKVRAEELIVEALALRRETLPTDHPAIAQSLSGLGALLADTDRLAQAREQLDEALSMLTRLHGREHKEVVDALLNLGKVALWMDDLGAAEARMREALSLATSLFGDRALAVASAQVHLGSLQRTRGIFREAADLWEDALDIRVEFLGEEHLLTAQLMVNLSRVARILSEPERAEELARRGLAVQEKILGPDHEELANGLANLGMALLALEQPDEGRTALLRALELHRATHGDVHTDVAMALFDLGRFEAQVGDDDRAAEHYDKALAVLRQTRPDDARVLGNTCMLFGEVQRRRGELEHAEELLSEAYRIHSQHLSPASPTLLMNRQELGVVLCQHERFDEALPHLEAPFRIYHDMHHGLSGPVLYVGLWLGRALAGLDRTEDAGEHYRKLVDYADDAVPDGSPGFADVLAAYGDFLLAIERPDEAAPLLERAIEMGPRVAPDAALAHAEARASLGLAYTRLARYEQAESHAVEAYEAIVAAESAEHASSRQALAAVIELYASWGREDEERRWRIRAE